MDADLDDEIIEISDTESIEKEPHASGHKRKRSHSSSDSDSSSSSEGVVWLDEESESEAEIECEYWDRDCIVLHKDTSKSNFRGYHLSPTCSLAPEELTRVQHVPELNMNLQNTNTILNIQTNWENQNAFNDAGIEIITDPWRACVVSDFLQNPTILNDLRQDFNDVKWHRRTLDLYEFFQSDDLEKVNLQHVKKIYDFICGDLKSWVATITGLELSEVSATCSFYSETDFLLVHDDQRGNRAVAFVIYMTGDDGWRPEWGGALQLLSRDDTGQPSSKNVRNIYPKNNQLVLFPVTDHSFHQVLEVTTSTAHPRLSINGWFHTPTSTIYDSPVNSPATTGGLRGARYTRPQYSLSIELRDWVMSPYLELRTAMQVQAYMEDSSEISLDGYVEKAAFGEVWRHISRQDLKWEHQGPLNRRNYSTLIEEDLPEKLVDFINIFKSGDFFKLLQEYTAIDYDHMRYEVQRWERGNYDLLGNRPESSKGMRLDVILYLCHDYDDQINSLNQNRNTTSEIELAVNSINEATPTEEQISDSRINFNDNEPTESSSTNTDRVSDEVAANLIEKSENITPDSTITSNYIDFTSKQASTYQKEENEAKNGIEQQVNSTDDMNLPTSDINKFQNNDKCEPISELRDDDVDMLNDNTKDDKSSTNHVNNASRPTTSTKTDIIEDDILNDNVGSSNDIIDTLNSHKSSETIKLNKSMPHDIIGGKLMYVDIKEKVQNALVTIVPNNNTINFVYGDTAHFTSYLSKKNPKNAYFYVVFASYYEDQRSEQEIENQNVSGDSD